MHSSSPWSHMDAFCLRDACSITRYNATTTSNTSKEIQSSVSVFTDCDIYLSFSQSLRLRYTVAPNFSDDLDGIIFVLRNLKLSSPAGEITLTHVEESTETHYRVFAS